MTDNDLPTVLTVTESARASGVDLAEPDELLDGLAVGLTIAFWRNTELEDAHSGYPFPGVTRKWRDQARGDFHAPGQVEEDRMADVLDGIPLGLGIPDDVMMRANAYTAFAVRRILRQHVAGGNVHGALAERPGWFPSVVALLMDLERPLRVGGSEFEAGDLLAGRLEAFASGVEAKVASHTGIGELLGWGVYAALMAYMARTFTGEWFPSPVWRETIERYRRQRPELPGDYFATVASTPWRLGYEAAHMFVDDRPQDHACAIRKDRCDLDAAVSVSGLVVLMLI